MLDGVVFVLTCRLLLMIVGLWVYCVLCCLLEVGCASWVFAAVDIVFVGGWRTGCAGLRVNWGCYLLDDLLVGFTCVT